MSDDASHPYFEPVEVEGFTLGMWVSYDDGGDAWVAGPDDVICGLVWETGEPEEFTVLRPPDDHSRWGTYAVRLPLPLTDQEEAAVYLRALLPRLRPIWEAWSRPGR